MTGAFIRKIPIVTGDWLPCDVVEGTTADAQDWHALVQPYIRSAPTFQPDSHWNWPRMVRATQFAESMLGRDCVYFRLTTFANGERVPLGQILLSIGYDFLPDVRQQSIYLWYLAAAPEGFLRSYGLPRVKILRPMIDTAIQFSLMSGYDGRVCLHAMPCDDPRYHAELFAKYQSVGLTPIPASQRIPKLTKFNDGRFLYCDNTSWLGISSALDYLR